MAVEEGTILEGTVTGIAAFGAFVRLPDGESGMVHISEVADAYVRDINDFLKVGDTVKVKVLPGHNGKISLSIKKANPPKKPSSKPMDIDWRSNRSNASSGPASFEDLMSKFMKDSEERLLDVKRSQDHKRSGYAKR